MSTSTRLGVHDRSHARKLSVSSNPGNRNRLNSIIDATDHRHSGTVAADDLIFEDPTWEAALEEELPPTVSVREVHQLNVLRRQGVFDRRGSSGSAVSIDDDGEANDVDVLKADTTQAHIDIELKKAGANAHDLDNYILAEHCDDIESNEVENHEATRDNGGGGMSPRRSELAFDLRLEIAADCIRDALALRETNTARNKRWQLLLYRFQRSKFWNILISLIVVANLSLIWVEPARSSEEWPTSLLILELVFVAFSLIDLCIIIVHSGVASLFRSTASVRVQKLLKGKKSFSRNVHVFTSRLSWRVATAVVILVTVVDILIYFVYPVMRFSRPFRALLLLRVSALRKHVVLLLGTIPALLDIVFLTVFIIIFYAIVCTRLFLTLYRDEDGNLFDDNFSDIQHALLSLYVLLTTDNYPDVMYPSFVQSRGWSILFVTFLGIQLYILLPVIVAVIFDSFKQQRKAKAIEDRVIERRGLLAAFKILDVGGRRTITKETFEALLQYVHVNKSAEEVDLLFRIIDADGNGTIDVLEFFELCDVLLLRFEKQPFSCLDTCAPSCCACFPQRALFRTAESQWFKGVFTVVIMIDILVLCIGANSPDSFAFNVTDVAFIFIFVVELLIRAMGLGLVRFVRDRWNMFELALIVLSGVFSLTTAVEDRRDIDGFNLRAFTSIRILRILSTSTRFRKFTKTFIQIQTPVGIVGGLLVMVFYVYAVIGLEVFRGLLAADPDYQDENPEAHFATPFNAFLTLFQLMTASNWASIMYSATRVTSLPIGAIYFCSFNFSVTIIVVNILISLVLELFVLAREADGNDEVLVLDGNEPDGGEGAEGNGGPSGGGRREKRLSTSQDLTITKRKRYSRYVAGVDLNNHLDETELAGVAAETGITREELQALQDVQRANQMTLDSGAALVHRLKRLRNDALFGGDGGGGDGSISDTDGSIGSNGRGRVEKDFPPDDFSGDVPLIVFDDDLDDGADMFADPTPKVMALRMHTISEDVTVPRELQGELQAIADDFKETHGGAWVDGDRHIGDGGGRGGGDDGTDEAAEDNTDETPNRSESPPDDTTLGAFGSDI